MKKINSFLIIIFVLTSGFYIYSQKTITKNIEYKNQAIKADLKFANTIEVKTWDKPLIQINVQLENEKYLDLYEINIQETKDEVRISSNVEPIFKKLREEYLKNNPNKKTAYFSSDEDYEFNYKICLPRDSKVEITSYTGSLKSQLISGDFTAKLGNGSIEILKYKGNLNLSTVTGEIDLKILNTSLIAETTYGDIYADKNLKLETINQTLGKKVEGSFNNAENKLQLSSIKGNIYLRL